MNIKKYIGLTIMAIALVFRGLILIFLCTPVAVLLAAGEWLTEYGDFLSGTDTAIPKDFDFGRHYQGLDLEERIKSPIVNRGPGYIWNNGQNGTTLPIVKRGPGYIWNDEEDR